MKPKFSIIMANYNNADYIGAAIESVQKQTFPDWELIIVDDASTDNSVDAIRPYLRDNRIKLFRHRTNKKYIETLITCLSHAQADLIGILDSDDALMPTALTKVITAHKKNPQASLVYTNFWYCDAGLNQTQLGPCRAIKQGSTNLRDDCVSHFKTFKKKAYQNTVGFEPAILAGEDFDLITKLEEVGQLVFINEPLFLYRRHSTSLTHNHSYNITAELSVMKIKYQAYRRRLGTATPNLTISEVRKLVIRAIFHSLVNFKFDQVKFFVKALYEL